MKQEAIAIVGISVFCPAGETVSEFWHNISEGRDFITEAPADVIEPFYFDGVGKEVDRFYCHKGGFTKPIKVDPLRYGILPIAAEGIDPDQLCSLAGVEQALHDADVFRKNIPLQRGSIIIGKGNFAGLIALRCTEIVRTSNMFVGLLRNALPQLTEDDLNKVRHAFIEKKGRFQADTAIGTMPNLVASMVANQFDMHGPAYTIDAACASGIVAINHSIKLLRDGECDIAVAGGMHGSQSAPFWSAFNIMGAISHKEQISPFSKDADGLLIGQGGGFIVLKTLSKAIEDEDRIYALINETAVCSDGAGSHVTVTSVKGQTRVLDMAWSKAEMDPAKVGYVEAHGTGTPVGDRTEMATLLEFFGDKTLQPAYVGSIKSNIGHTMAAAGMVGVIKTALSLYHRTIPPTLHCEEPLETMQDSRFQAPQEAIPWDEEKYPLVAGVNAFGFGGINSHAILSAYQPEPGAAAQPTPKPYLGEALMVSATSKEALLDKVKTGNYTNTGGDYRLVVFDPTDERLDKAVSIIELDKPWLGRLDIWFTNNPLLVDDGKLVFMFPGIYVGPYAETQSICRHLDLESFDDFLDLVEVKADDRNNEEKIHALRVSYVQWITKKALQKLGIEADLYIGHSVGEWTAADVAGITSGGSIGFATTDAQLEESDKCPLIVVSGMDVQTAETWCSEIPDLYLANDNCPGQLLLSCKPEATAALIERLEKEQYLHSVLPYGYGYHTPLLEDKVEALTDFLDYVVMGPGDVPVWSATTLEQVPTEHGAYAELVKSQLTKPVYFRGLIEKLHREQGARVFVQIGMGSLPGFVEDTLSAQDFGALSCNVTTRDGADQLRRILALLFVEGKTVDADFLGVKLVYQVEHNLLILPTGAPLLTDIPELEEVVKEHYGPGAAATDAFLRQDATFEGDPLQQMISANLRDAMQVQTQVVNAFRDVGAVNGVDRAASVGGSASASPVTAAPAPPAASQPSARENFEEALNLTYQDCPYLVDHSIVRQPLDWDHQEDFNPVVPLTMTIELLAEIAKRRMPDKKLLSIKRVMAYQWIGLEKPFDGTIKGRWKKPDILELELVGHAKAEFVFGDSWSEPPDEYKGELDIGKKIIFDMTTERLYDKYSFHGPQYQSCVDTIKICERGIFNTVRKREGKGSLLDIMGQQLGLFLHLTETKDTISFPVRLKELTFYSDIFDQDGLFEHTLIITRLDESSIVGDMVLTRDGKIWAIAHDFVCQRFVNDIPVWMCILKPQSYKLAKEIAPGVYHYLGGNRNNVLLFLHKRYLNYADNKEYQTLKTPERQREFLFSRMALKDAVRDFVATDEAGMLFPIEVFCEHDANGKPLIHGVGKSTELLEGLEVSLSHKDHHAIAMVARTPVGVDIEKVEDKSEGFITGTFTDAELKLLGSEPSAEQITRFWVAKEVCAKKTGLGLQGNPKNFEVKAVEGDRVLVGNDYVQTTLIGTDYLAGWTL